MKVELGYQEICKEKLFKNKTKRHYVQDRENACTATPAQYIGVTNELPLLNMVCCYYDRIYFFAGVLPCTLYDFLLPHSTLIQGPKCGLVP
jgi:hypothetical protein